MNKKISLVGVGMDGAATLTAEAKEAIATADELVGAKRLLEMFARLKKPAFASCRGADIAEHIAKSKYESTAVLLSGDCGFFSGARALLPLLREYGVRVVAGISTPVYFCSKLCLPWSELHFVSLHGREGSVVRPVCSHEKTFFLLGGKVTPAEICRKLTEYGLGALTVHVGENLALENERIVSGEAAELTGLDCGGLCAVIVENPAFERGVRACMPDGEFVRAKAPMTKAEVRCVAVAKLGIAADSVCWDIGAGTGSVSVEAALRCGEGRVFAVEREAEAVELINKNKIKFGCDNIETVFGEAPEVLAALPAPDRVFIGGSGGRLGEICAAVRAKNPAALVVAAAVTLETLSELAELFSEDREIIQLAVTRAKKVGKHTMFSAENPVFLVKGTLK